MSAKNEKGRGTKWKGGTSQDQTQLERIQRQRDDSNEANLRA